MKDKDKLKQLLEHNDNNPQALYEIAVIYKKLKEYKKAEEYFIKAKQAGHYAAQYDLEELYANGYLNQLNMEEANEAAANTNKADSDPDYKPVHSAKNIQTKIIIALCAVIVLLIAVGVVVFMIMSNNNNNNSSNNNTSSAVSGVISEKSSAVSEVDNSNSNDEAQTEEPAVAETTVAPSYDPVTLDGVDTSKCWLEVAERIRKDELDDPIKYIEYVFKDINPYNCYSEEIIFDSPKAVELLHYTLSEEKSTNKGEHEPEYLYLVIKTDFTLSGKTKKYLDDKSGGTIYMAMRADSYEVDEKTGIITLPNGVESIEKDNDSCYIDPSLAFIEGELDKSYSLLYDLCKIEIKSGETQETTK